MMLDDIVRREANKRGFRPYLFEYRLENDEGDWIVIQVSQLEALQKDDAGLTDLVETRIDNARKRAGCYHAPMARIDAETD